MKVILDDKISKVYCDKELINIFKMLLRINSENPGKYEEDLSIKIHNILENEGIKSELVYVAEGRPNLYCFLKGKTDGKTVILNGHLDTVPAGNEWKYDPYGAYEDSEGFIYGRGASDMKAGLASMLYALICLKRMGYPKRGNILLFFNVDEEAINLGIKEFLKRNIQADYAIVGEPTELNVSVGHRGVARFLLRTRGTSAHSGVVNNPDNAIEKMNALLPDLFRWGIDIKKEKQNKLLGNAFSNITMIRGGTAANIIPDMCEVEIDRRLLPGETEEQVFLEYDNLLKNKNIPYELENYTFLPASLIDDKHPFVKKVHQIVLKYNKNSEVNVFGACCEAAFFSIHNQIPTIIYGPGSLKEAHVINEKIHKSQVALAAKSYIEICIKLLQNEVE